MVQPASRRFVTEAGPPGLTDGMVLVYDGTAGKLVPGKLFNTASVTSGATLTPTGNSRTNDLFVTALAVTAAVANPSGTAVNGNRVLVRIKDNGTARALTFGTLYRAVGVSLPTTTTVSKTLYIGAVYNSTDLKWDVIAVGQE